VGYLSKVPATAVQTALHVIAIAAFVTLALTPHRTAGYLLALAGLLVVAGRGSETGLLNAIPAVTLLAAAVLVPLPHTATTAFIALALVYLIVSQSALLALGRKARTQALNLPGYAEPRRLAIPADAMAAANVIMVAAIGAIGYAKWPVWPVAAAVAAECAAVAIVTADVMYRRFKGASDVSHFRAALEKHAPSFIVYFSDTSGQEFQLLSWLPQLDSIGEPYLIVVRNWLSRGLRFICRPLVRGAQAVAGPTGRVPIDILRFPHVGQCGPIYGSGLSRAHRSRTAARPAVWARPAGRLRLSTKISTVSRSTAKSATFSVTTARPSARAVAATRASSAASSPISPTWTASCP